MKRLLFLTIVSITITYARGQNNVFNFPIDSTTGKITFQDVVQMGSLKKDDLFNKVKLWVINNYPSPKDVINVEDKDIGVLKLKPQFKRQKKSENLTYDEVIYFDLDIYVKDGRYKYIITNLKSSTVTSRSTSIDKNPIEKPFLISKDDTEQMKYYDFRKTWSDEIKSDVAGLVASLNTFLVKKNDTDF
jgi:hypothetical protein